jgi:hypothetical protein
MTVHSQDGWPWLISWVRLALLKLIVWRSSRAHNPDQNLSLSDDPSLLTIQGAGLF